MDSKINWIRGLVVSGIVAFVALFTGCKENNWLDWKVQNELWLVQNAQKDSVVELASGLQYKVLADPGAKNGEAIPNPDGSTIVCDYTVKLINGYQIQGGNSVSLYLPNTIPGFSEGCHHIHNHGDIELYIPAYLGYDYEKYQADSYYDAEGYGTEGTSAYIPPYSTLIYRIHICGISGN